MRLALLCLAATACASVSPREPACTTPAERAEIQQVQVGWQRLDPPLQRPIVDPRVPTRAPREAEQLATDLLEQCRRGAEDSRLVLSCVRRRLAMREGEIPAQDDILSARRFAHLGKKTRQELLAMQQNVERVLKHHEDALRIGTTVLGECGER